MRKLMVSDTIRNSRNLHVEFVTGHRQHDPPTYGDTSHPPSEASSAPMNTTSNNNNYTTANLHHRRQHGTNHNSQTPGPSEAVYTASQQAVNPNSEIRSHAGPINLRPGFAINREDEVPQQVHSNSQDVMDIINK